MLFRLLTVVGISILALSCNSLKVKTIQPFARPVAPIKVALIATVIGKIEQPLFPLIDASIYNAKTFKIATQLMAQQDSAANQYQAKLKDILEKNLGIQIVTQPEFILADSTKTLPEFPQALLTHNEHFPRIHIPANERMHFDFPKGDFRKAINSNQFITTCEIYCKALGVDAVLVSHSNLRVFGVSGFGINGAVGLETEFTMVSKTGQVLAKGSGLTKREINNGKDIGHFSKMLNQIDFLADVLAKDMVGIPYKEGGKK